MGKKAKDSEPLRLRTDHGNDTSRKGDLHSSSGILSDQKEGWAAPLPPCPPSHSRVKKGLSVLCRLPFSESVEELVIKCKSLDPTLRRRESESGVGDPADLPFTGASVMCMLESHWAGGSLLSFSADPPRFLVLEF